MAGAGGATAEHVGKCSAEVVCVCGRGRWACSPRPHRHPAQGLGGTSPPPGLGKGLKGRNDKGEHPNLLLGGMEPGEGVSRPQPRALWTPSWRRWRGVAESCPAEESRQEISEAGNSGKEPKAPYFSNNGPAAALGGGGGGVQAPPHGGGGVDRLVGTGGADCGLSSALPAHGHGGGRPAYPPVEGSEPPFPSSSSPGSQREAEEGRG